MVFTLTSVDASLYMIVFKIVFFASIGYIFPSLNYAKLTSYQLRISTFVTLIIFFGAFRRPRSDGGIPTRTATIALSWTCSVASSRVVSRVTNAKTYPRHLTPSWI